ncbi:unnamed protein product [Paramecium pentaurelia]|uniref:Transmembrane protein n=1 Tax=Paramecium pentaurelia TaxID=43138 RepID=A0A8S1WE36_9CILI|nr:unnamed protein product [Paramecium pentaurelia]
MLQFNSIQLLLLVLAVTTYSNEVFETNTMIPISVIAQIRNTEFKNQTPQNQLLDKQNQVSDDKNEVNNLFLIESPKKSLKVFSQKSLLVEHQPEEVQKESSQQNDPILSQEQKDQQNKISIKVNKKLMKDTEISQENNIEEQHSLEKEELQPIQNNKIPIKISQENQEIENNDENEITIQDIKIESIHKEPISKIEENKSQNEDVIIIKIDEEIKATPRIFGILDNDQIKQENLEDELSLENDQDKEEIEQCEGEELDTIHQQQENKRQESNKLNIDSKNNKKTTKKLNENNKKLTSNVLNNNKKQQSSRKNSQQQQQQQSQKNQGFNSKEADQKLIGELIKVQAEVDDVDLSIFTDDHSDLIPIIVQDQENTIINSTDDELQDTQSQQELNEINNQDTIIDVNQELNQDQIDVVTTQNLDIDGESFQNFQSELDELARELDQLSLDQILNSKDNNESENLQNESNNESLQYITISTNNDPIIVNSLEDDYFLDDLDNELSEQTQQQEYINTANESSNQQNEVQILIVDNPEQLIIQNETKDEIQSQDEIHIESEIEYQFNEEQSQEIEINISIDNNNDEEISINKEIQDNDENQVQNDFKQPIQLDNDMEMRQSEQYKPNEFKEIDFKKNSIIKKEVSVNLDNMITNENINDQDGLNDDEFLRIATESEAEIIENLEDLQDGMETVQFDKKVQNQIYTQPDKNQRNQKYIDNNKEYSLKIDQNRKQSRFEEDYLDQIKNTQIRDQYQKSKEDEFNQMINDLINEFDFKSQRDRDIIEYDRQITQHIIDNMEESRYGNRVFNRDFNEQDNEEQCDDEVDNNDQEFQEAYTEFKKVVQNKEEFDRECNDQVDNSQISDYEKDIDKRKKQVIDKIKKELMLKKERLKNNNKQRSDNLSTYDFERIYLDWATNKEDIVYNMLLHTSNSDMQSQTLDEVQNTKVERISKKQEVEEELQKLYSNYEKDRKGRYLRGQR